MQKISYQVYEKMVAEHLTANEIDFLLYIGRFQDDHGLIRGVYYKDVCRQLEMSYQAFYDAKRSLMQKGIIECSKRHYSDWDIKILDNDFSTSQSYERGYININHRMFREKNFRKLKAGAKLMAMDFLKINLTTSRSFAIGTGKIFEKYTVMLGVTKRVIQGYLTMLRLFFSIGIKDRIYYITARAFSKQKPQRTENEELLRHTVKKACRRNRIKETTEKELKDTMTVLTMYKNYIKEDFAFDLDEIIHRSIDLINENIKKQNKWKYILRPSLIHRLVKKKFGIA